MPAMLQALVANAGRRMKPQQKPQGRKVAGKTGTVRRWCGSLLGSTPHIARSEECVGGGVYVVF